MATAGEMTNIVAEALALPEATVVSYQTMLRKSGLITIGGRGRSAPQMTPLDVSRLVIAILGAEALAEATAVVELFGALLCQDVQIQSEVPAYNGRVSNYNLEDAFAMLLKCHLAAQENREADCKWFGLDVREHSHMFSLFPHELFATIKVGPVECYYQYNFVQAEIIPRNKWPNLPIKDRLIARSYIHGILIRRSIGDYGIMAAAGALHEVPKLYPPLSY